MKTLTKATLAAVVGVIVIVGFAYSGIYDVSASSAHSSIVEWALSTTSHASIRRRAKDVAVPDLDDESLALAGVNDFNEMCAGCHGAPGQDPEAMGQGLNPPAPNLAESAQEMTAAELFWVTKNGIKMTGMPAWGNTHSDENLWPVVALIRHLPELDSDTYQAMLTSAAGMGHHADSVSTAEHSHGEEANEGTADEHSGSNHHDQPMQQEQPPEEAEEHDHSAHEH